MNQIDEPSMYRTKIPSKDQAAGFTTIGSEATNENAFELDTLQQEVPVPYPTEAAEPLLDDQGAE